MCFKPKNQYSVVYLGEDDRYIRMDFERLSDAEMCAREHDTVIVQNCHNDDLEYKLGKATDVLTILGLIAILSLIGWGWLAILSLIGVI